MSRPEVLHCTIHMDGFSNILYRPSYAEADIVCPFIWRPLHPRLLQALFIKFTNPSYLYASGLEAWMDKQALAGVYGMETAMYMLLYVCIQIGTLFLT